MATTGLRKLFNCILAWVSIGQNKLFENNEQIISRGRTRSKMIQIKRYSNLKNLQLQFMKVYKGLDVVTAKVTKEEQAMVPHHMIDIVNPSNRLYTVVDFRNKALPIMDSILERKKVPIIVGGTNYWIESLLWQILIGTENNVDDNESVSTSEKNDKRPVEENSSEDDDRSAKKMKHSVSDLFSTETTQQLHQKLQEVDPEMARRTHPNNRRKIIRSLEVFQQNGTRHSEILKLQRLAGGSGLGGPLRHENSIVLWLRCDQDVLDERLDKRVDSMLENGLIDELLDFHKKYNEERVRNNALADYTTGIFQSIGFKEFHNYLILPEEERKSERGQQFLQQGITELKIATRQYSRRQKRWVMNRFIRRQEREEIPVYTLDCTDVEQWNEKVLKPAEEIVSAHIANRKPDQKPLNQIYEDKKTTDSSTDNAQFCETCERHLMGEFQWKAHLEGAKHKKMVNRKKREEQKAAQENESKVEVQSN